MVNWKRRFSAGRLVEGAEARVQHLFAGGHLFHGGDHFEIERVLQEVATHARLQAGANVRRLGVHAQDQNAGFRVCTQDVPRGYRTIHAGHGEIHDHHTRPKFGSGLHGLRAIFGLAYNGNCGIVFQHAAKAAAHQAMVVYQQDGNAWFSHESPERSPVP